MDKLAAWAQHLDWQGSLNFELPPGGPLTGKKRVVVAGMGGSGLVGDLLKIVAPQLEVIVHKDYGLPQLATAPDVFIAISHSGATAETLDSFKAAGEAGWPRVVMALEGSALWKAGEGGGRLVLPKTLRPDGQAEWPARFDALLMLRATLALLGLPNEAQVKTGERSEGLAHELAAWLGPSAAPLIYSSGRNQPLAHYWEVQLEETAKRPTATNFLPELDHNELEALADNPKSTDWRVLILTVEADDERVRSKARLVGELYQSKGLPTRELKLGAHSLEETLWLAGATALSLAATAGLDPFGTPAIESFKQHVSTL